MRLSLFTFLLLATTLTLHAQESKAKRTFSAGIIGGFNAAQIDGDALAGYNKFGLHGGLRVSVRIAPLWEPSLEILFSQKGSRSSNEEGIIQGGKSNYSMNYVEIPLLMNYRDKGFTLNAGFSYARLLQLREISIGGVDVTDTLSPFYRRNDFLLLAGIGYFFTDHIGIGIQYSRSIFSIVDYQATTLLSSPQINRLLSFRLLFLL